MGRFNNWLKRTFRRIKVFFLYDAATFVYAFLMTGYLWIGAEGTFLFVLSVVNSHFNLTEGQAAVVFSFLHSLLLLSTAWAYIRIKDDLNKMNHYLRQQGVVYTLHSDGWHELFVALFSVAISLYIFAVIILIAYELYPEKLEGGIEVPLAVLYLILVSYVPIVFLIHKVAKIGLYLRHARKLTHLFVPREFQRNN